MTMFPKAKTMFPTAEILSQNSPKLTAATACRFPLLVARRR